MTDPSDMEALALAAESFGRLAEAINTVTEKMADAIARNATDIRELRDENRALSNRLEAQAQWIRATRDQLEERLPSV